MKSLVANHEVKCMPALRQLSLILLVRTGSDLFIARSGKAEKKQRFVCVR